MNGPISATVALLIGIGWEPSQPDYWVKEGLVAVLGHFVARCSDCGRH